jgi:hypothetical protein
MNEDLCVTFEYSLDEAVAFQLKCIKATKEGSSWRKREQMKFAISFVCIVACLLIFASQDRRPVLAAECGFASGASDCWPAGAVGADVAA